MEESTVGPWLDPLLPDILRYAIAGRSERAFNAFTADLHVLIRATRTLWIVELSTPTSKPWGARRTQLSRRTKGTSLDALLRLLKRAIGQYVRLHDPDLHRLRCQTYNVTNDRDITVPEGNTRPTSFDDMSADDCHYWMALARTQPLRNPA